MSLVVEGSAAGALGFLAAGYKSAAAMSTEIVAVRSATSAAFGVNVFVPGEPATERAAIRDYLATLYPEAEAVGGLLGEPNWDDDDFEAKVETLLEDPVPAVSFTFGCPSPKLVDAFRTAGTVVIVTVTTRSEAAIAEGAGADALCVQGHEAGAHRGTFTNRPNPGPEPALLDLVAHVASVSDLPLIATGGIMGSADIDAVLTAGAVAAQCGTAFLRCPESGASLDHKAALGSGRYKSTVVTRAFTGRAARGLLNQFILDHPDAPAAYPEINNATRPMRAAAAARHDPDRLSLWAGTGYRSAKDQPAAHIVADLCGHLR